MIKRKAVAREKNGRWKNGTDRHNRGYIRIKIYDHPYAHKRNYIYQHRLVMEAHIGRYLLPTEIVHHKNGIKWDNRIENLELQGNNKDHVKAEMREIAKKKRRNKHGQFIKI